ncbi:MAG TPA: FAD-dependent oxidoreductase [Candidatus Binatia bacterium]|nr:FAD-dependent oxidoreductase [Candidatus Binatia bacterium]
MTPRTAVVLGAGPTGLSAALTLGDEAVLVERESRVGGCCRSIVSGGFTFDHAGHIMFSNDPYVHDLYRLLLGDNVHWQEREAWIYSKGVHTRYPFQGALYGLPNQVIKECLVGAIEARFGPLRPPDAKTLKPMTCAAAEGNGNGHANGNGHSNGHGNGHANGHVNGHANGHANGHGRLTGGDVKDCCADGILEAEAPLAAPEALAAAEGAPWTEPRSFEEFIYRVWGSGIAKHFAIPYNRKLWKVPLDQMETSWLGGRVPLPDLEEMIDGALSPVPKPMGPNARFGYPLRGGFQALMDGFLPRLRADLRLETEAVRLCPSKRMAWLSDGSTLEYETLISTIPLPRLVRLLGPEAPSAVRDAAAGLRHLSVRCVNLGVGRPDLTEKHWIYYPEDTVFHRIFVQGNASPHCNPPGGFGLTCEITYSGDHPLPADGEALTERCIADCRRVGLIGDEDPIWTACQADLPYAYVIYDHERRERVEHIRAWLLERDIFLAGRFSEWEYYNSDHAFIAGRNAALKACERREERRALTRRPGRPAPGTERAPMTL